MALTADSEQLLVAGTDGLHIFKEKKKKKKGNENFYSIDFKKPFAKSNLLPSP